MTVLVVGGGITGLTTAYTLGRAGVPTLLVEASDRLGGKVRTDRIDGFLVESGPDSFISYRPAGLELCRELGLADAIIRPLEPRTVTVRIGERFVRLPDGMGLVLPTRIRPFVTTRLFSAREKARMGLDLVLPRRLDGYDVAVGSFLRGRLGGALVDRLAGPLIGGVYGTPIDELSLDAVVPTLRDAERDHRSLLLASLAQGRARRRAGTPTESPFVSLTGGIGQLVEALVQSIRASDAVAVRTGVRVAAIERSGGRFTATFHDGERAIVDGLAIATPAGMAADLLEGLSPAGSAHLRTIAHGSTGVATLGYHADDLPGPLVGHGFLVAAGEPLSVSACTWSSNKWPGRAPADMVLLRAFVGSRPDLLRRPDAEIVGVVRRDLMSTMGIRTEPVLARVSRFPGQMPHYTVGHLDRVAAATRALDALPGIVVAGAAYHGVGLPDCIAQGRGAAERLRLHLAGGSSADPGPSDSPAQPARSVAVG